MRHSFPFYVLFSVLMILPGTSKTSASTDSLNTSYLKTNSIKIEALEDTLARNFFFKMFGSKNCYRASASKYFSELYFVADTAKMEIYIFTVFPDSSLGKKNPDMTKTNDSIYFCSCRLETKDDLYLNDINLALDLKNNVLFYRWTNPTGKNEPSISDKNTLLPGTQFPDIKFKSLKGKEVKLKNNRIKVINWWSTTCIPCREEIPGLNKLVEKYKSKNIDFIAVVSDNDKLNQFLKMNTFSYSQHYSKKETIKYFGNAYPRHVIVDGDNNIVYNRSGGSADIYLKLDKVIEILINK